MIFQAANSNKHVRVMMFEKTMVSGAWYLRIYYRFHCACFVLTRPLGEVSVTFSDTFAVDFHKRSNLNTCLVELEMNCVTRLTTTRSEEHTSELQSLMRISYAVFCLKKKNYET